MVHIKISLEREEHKEHVAHAEPHMSAPAPKPHVAQYRSPRRKSILIGAVVVVAIGAAGWWVHASHKKFTGPFSANIRQSVSFQLYYPKMLPAGYTYKVGSAAIADGDVLFYRFVTASGQVVSVSEQAKPATQLALSSLVGYSPLQGTVGQGVIGSQNSQPSALLETQRTLISISGTQDVPGSAISSIAKSLAQVE